MKRARRNEMITDITESVEVLTLAKKLLQENKIESIHLDITLEYKKSNKKTNLIGQLLRRLTETEEVEEVEEEFELVEVTEEEIGEYLEKFFGGCEVEAEPTEKPAQRTYDDKAHKEEMDEFQKYLDEEARKREQFEINNGIKAMNQVKESKVTKETVEGGKVQHKRRRLKSKEVEEIKQKYFREGKTTKALAKEYGATESSITNLLLGVTYKDTKKAESKNEEK